MKPSSLIGKKAPAFSLPDQNGKTHTRGDYRGKWLVLYFYPKDDTPGCTKEACGFRDWDRDFARAGITVVGASADSVASHKKFAKKYGLGFVLLADEKKEAVNAYGAWGKKKFMGREYTGTLRTTFLIDPRGKVVRVYENVKPPEHAKEIFDDFRALRGARA